MSMRKTYCDSREAAHELVESTRAIEKTGAATVARDNGGWFCAIEIVGEAKDEKRKSKKTSVKDNDNGTRLGDA